MINPMAGAAMAVLLAACSDNAGGERGAAPAPARTAATTPGAPAADKAPERRTFRDWLAVCDNGDACVAYTGGAGGAWIRVGMTAGAQARPSVQVGMWPETEGSPPQRAVLTIDGLTIPLELTETRPIRASVADEHVEAAAAALVSGHSITVTAGPDTVELPASGASAALLWIDERQGRLDTVTALNRRGDRPASVVPAGPALPVATPAAGIAQTGFEGRQRPTETEPVGRLALSAELQALPAVRQCLSDTADQPHLRDAILAARLAPDIELWGVPCDSGAYNATYVMYVTGAGGSRPKPAILPNPDPATAAAVSESTRDLALTNPEYDPATRTLSHFSRGRGIGDCGVIQSWVWTARGFAMREAREMDICWGMPSNLWPTIWRTR